MNPEPIVLPGLPVTAMLRSAPLSMAAPSSGMTARAAKAPNPAPAAWAR